MKDIDDKPKINMLLNVDHFFGEHESRLGPVIVCLCIAFAPLLAYVYYTLYFIIPVWLFLPLWAFYALRCFMKIIGKESMRVDNYLKQLYDMYSTLMQLVTIKTIHEDGAIEYIFGKIKYIVICHNGSFGDPIKKSVLAKKFQTKLVADKDFDIDIQNINSTDALDRRYANIKVFADNSAASNYVKIIDNYRNIVRDKSQLTRVVYTIKGTKSDWKTIKSNIDSAIKSSSAKAYKEIHIVSSPDEVEEILSRDINSNINIKDIIKKKYARKEYYGSKILSYDNQDEIVPKDTTEDINNSFYTTL